MGRNSKALCCTQAAFVLLALVLPRHCLGQDASRPPVLHALLVIDTDSNLGASVAKDLANMQRVLQEGFRTRPHRLELHILQGPDCTRQNVLLHYASMSISATDSIFFYYTGHGTTLEDKGHCLTMHHDADDGDYLSRAELRDVVGRLNPRLSVFLTDCCSKTVPERRGVDVVPAPPATWPVMDLLFFHHQGVTDINGCQEDAFSWCYVDSAGVHQGGTFTLALVPLLCSKKALFSELFGANDGFVTWRAFAQRLQQDTDDWYQKLQLDVQETQLPQLHEVGSKAPQIVRDNTWMLGVELADARLGGRSIAVVTKVRPDTPAAAADLRRGDAILAIDGIPANDKFAVLREVDRSDGQVAIRFLREGQEEEKTIDLVRVRPLQ